MMRYSPDLRARRQVIADPGILLDFAGEDRGQVVALVEEVVPLGHHADAHQVVRQGDVPEPAAIGHVGHGGRAFVDSRVAQRAAEVGPDGHLVERRVPLPPVVLLDAQGARARWRRWSSRRGPRSGRRPGLRPPRRTPGRPRGAGPPPRSPRGPRPPFPARCPGASGRTRLRNTCQVTAASCCMCLWK